jgi:hypothetical protein
MQLLFDHGAIIARWSGEVKDRKKFENVVI